MADLRKCCNQPSKFSIVYDAGNQQKQELLICDFHYNCDEVFRKNILKIEEVLD
ncbi:hypothetical protein [Nitrosopumilus sp. b3]|uniref:hypothetical protein n=1 Tax=Nitrosopumilus sp. b3 TaxID=2109909 RepID=UPI0015F5129A|nr:hypothetical protein [Nitrosopumilus sp. b3]